MQPLQKSIKHIKIDKANATMMVSIGIAAFVAVFTLVSSKTLLSQYSYQNRVIAAKKTAKTQLIADVAAVNSLSSSYKTFDSGAVNLLGGDPTGTGPNSGDNGQIILDALPSEYDYPGLVASLQNTLSGHGYTITALTGTDEELSQGSAPASASPQPIPIAFSITAQGTYTQIQDMLNTLQLSIRPINITSITLTGTDSAMTISLKANTYYQPGKKFSISTETIK